MVVRFRSEFLRRFPPHLRNELQQLLPLVNGLELRAASAPQLTWPPPETPPEKLDFFLEMLWQSNVRRAVALYRGIVESLNESNFLVFAVLFRALFEQVVLLRAYWHHRISPVMAESAKEGVVTTAQLRQLITELHTAVARTKVEWAEILKGNIGQTAGAATPSDTVRLKAAAKAWTDEVGRLGMFTPLQLYDLLCDAAHPNFGGTILMMKDHAFGWANTSDSSIGARTFGLLYPSLAAVSNDFQRLLNLILLSKFEANQT